MIYHFLENPEFSLEEQLPGGENDWVNPFLLFHKGKAYIQGDYVGNSPTNNMVEGDVFTLPELEPVNFPVIPVSITTSDTLIEVGEIVPFTVKFAISEFGGQPFSQSFHIPIQSESGEVVLNQQINIVEGEGSVSIVFDKPVSYFIKEDKMNQKLEAKGLPFRIEFTDGDIEIEVFRPSV